VSAETPTDALAAVARHTARIQIAALGGVGAAVAGWTRAANRFAQTVGDELLRRIDGEVDSRESIIRLASATDAHLHELATLPAVAANHFDTRLSRVSIDK